jgi:hypothetical protein
MKALFVTLFFVLLLLPAIQNGTGITLVTPVEEYRRKAEAPLINLKALLHDRGDLHRKFLAWYDDRYGCRDLLIKLKTQIDYTLFSKSDRIHIGKEGWLYYRNVLDNQKPQVERQPRKAMHDYYEHIRTLALNLRDRGITMVVLRMPLKDAIYPEFLPATVPHFPDKRNADLVSELLNSSLEIVNIDVTAELKELKPSLQIFHKTDFHWTDPAGFHIARDLVNTLHRLEGKKGSLWSHELKISHKQFSGGQARFMPLLYAPEEISLFIEKTWQDATTYEKGTPPFREIYRTKDDGASNLLPTTVVKGNSFFDALLRSGVQNYFKELYICQSNVTFPDVLQVLPVGTRYFVVQELAGISEHLHAVKWRGLQ